MTQVHADKNEVFGDADLVDTTKPDAKSQHQVSTQQQAQSWLQPKLPDLLALRRVQLEPFLAYLYGNRQASILVLKGARGTAEQGGSPPFFGADGAALTSAFEALGWGANGWCGILLEPLGLPMLDAQQVRLLVEYIDPLVVVALDAAAAAVLAGGFEHELFGKKLKMGKKTGVLGRLFLAIDDFESALNNPERKQMVWAQLKVLKKR
jgi:hypothetical protein